MRRKEIRSIDRQQGFTLIEIMVVVAIIAILAVMIVPGIMGRPEQARRVKARSDIMAIQNALDMYRLDNGFYPSTEQGLEALLHKPAGEPVPMSWQKGGYLKSDLLDPWGRKYQYRSPGEHGEMDVWSQGKDPKEEEEIIGNWVIEKNE